MDHMMVARVEMVLRMFYGTTLLNFAQNVIM